MYAAPPPHLQPLHDLQQDAGAEFIAFGEGDAATPLVASFEQYEAEYAAIRSRVGVLHLPQRGLLRFTGDDRQDFLHRLLTQDINPMRSGDTRRSFQLNSKGRIVADLLVHHGDADTWLELDAVDIAPLRELLESRLFTEDVTIDDLTDQRTHLALHGPAAGALLQKLTDADTAPAVNTPGTHHVLPLLGRPTTVYRLDDAGAMGLHLLAPVEHAAELYQALLEHAGFDPQDDPNDPAVAQRRRDTLRGRPIGWLAYNTARIEAGSPLFHIDFGPDSIPAETALLDQTVSFTKGCYLGQEIVARMQNLGHPKRVLVPLRFGADALPVAGAPVHVPAGPDEAATAGDPVGAVTSSTLSPMLSHTAIAFAVVKWGRHTPGTTLAVPCEGAMAEATVADTLSFIA